MRFPTCFRRSLLGILFLFSGFILPGAPCLRAQAPGTVDPVFGGASLGLSGNVQTVALQPDGKVLVGGSFDRGLVRLDTDGSLDAGFNVGISTVGFGAINVLLLQPDGKIIAGGSFTEDGSSLSQAGFVRFNADGSLDASFHAGTDNRINVSALALQPDGKIVASGFYYYQDGTGQQTLARLNADGSLDAGFNATVVGQEYDRAAVTALAVQPDGKILAGGYFSAVDSANQTNLVRLNADGSLDAGFDNAVTGLTYYGYGVRTITMQADGEILVGGEFIKNVDSSGYGTGYGITRLNADGSLDAGFNSDIGGVETIALQPDGKILIGGFTVCFINDIRQDGLARLNADGSLDTSFIAGTGESQQVYALALQSDGKIVIGGSFTQINGVGSSSVVRLAADGQTDRFFNADAASGPNAEVTALVLQPDSKLIIGGSFSQSNGIGHDGLARLNANGSLDISFRADLGGSTSNYKLVSALILQPDGKIIVSGTFGQVNGTTQMGLARLNTDGSLDTGFVPVGDYSLTDSLALQPDGKVLVGGDGVMVRLNINGSLDGSFAANVGGEVETLALQPDGKIVIGGNFSQADGVDRDCLARLNADGSLDAGFIGNGGNDLRALALQSDGKILVAGGPDGLGRLNADGTPDTNFVAGVDSYFYAYALALQPDGKTVVGGHYSLVGGSQVHLVRLNTDGTWDPFFNAGGSGPDDDVNSLAIQPDGKIFVGGSFTSVNGVLRNYVARLNGGGAPDMFGAGVPVGGGFYYEQFPDGLPFGYYNLSGNDYTFPYFFHVDLGLEYFFDANDGKGGAYLFDFASGGFFYTSPTFPWPYLYDFSLNTVLYYYPDPSNPGHYNTDGYRFFYRFDTGQTIVK